jgi:hypothetical protein
VKNVLRRLRGLIGTGLAGAFAWVAFSAGLLALGVRWDLILANTPANAVLGFTLGVTFGVILSVVERRTRFEDLSLGRVAFSGWMAGILVAAASMLLNGLGHWELLIAYSLPAAGIAAGIFAVGKRAGKTKLIEGDDEQRLIP